jgi:mannonate dehydratase
MHLGFGLYRHQLDDAHFAFARQAGATHLVVHLVDYFRKSGTNSRSDQPVGDQHGGWGYAGNPDVLWTAEELTALRTRVEAHDLKLHAIENLDPAHWHQVLFSSDAARRHRHLENVKQIIRVLGQAGIPALGYCFSMAGVAGRVTGPFARGGASGVGMNGAVDVPIPKKMAWNMIVDESAGEVPHPTSTREQLLERRRNFLNEVLPVAEQAGVRLAAHPDDPPVPTLRGTPRLIHQPRHYQQLIDDHPSMANGLELCVGTLAEASDDDHYDWIDRYAQQQRIVYVHLRNVRGKAPYYHETFLDDGQVDVERVLRILRKHRFDGVIIPDHAPQMNCSAPWHAGMAFAMGYLKAAMRGIENEALP